MNSDELAAQMRSMEHYHSVRLPANTWAVVRVDGRAFSRLTETHYKKPFDTLFHEHMLETAKTLTLELQGTFTYAQSDEISVLLRPDWSMFDREHEKLVSLAAGIASATYALASGKLAHFDARVWLASDEQSVLDYFRWRQSDATRCALNTCCYWTLRNAGESVSKATRALEQASVKDKYQMLAAHEIDFDGLPTWQRRGVALLWENYRKMGVDPRTSIPVEVSRRRIKIESEIPAKEAWNNLVSSVMHETTVADAKSGALSAE